MSAQAADRLNTEEPVDTLDTASTTTHLALDERWVARLTSYAVASPRAELATTFTPLTGRPLARVPLSTVADVGIAVDGARQAQRFWSLLPVKERAGILLRFHDLLLRHRGEMLDLIQLESGKARLHAFEEIVDVAQVARYYARTAAYRLRPRTRPGLVPGLTGIVEVRHPHGVVGIVTPWNFPLAMGISDTLPALVAGNAVVLRPDLQAPLTALFCADLLQRAGLPQRVLQVVIGDGPTIGAAVLRSTDSIVFTGSSQTGRRIAAEAGGRLQPATFELGGKNPLYVADDADLRRAVDGAVRACFVSAGQMCVSTERLILHERIAEPFLTSFLAATNALRLGPDLTFAVDLGTLASAAQLARVEAHVEQAVERGAAVLAGGRRRPDLGPYFYEPTVLTGVTRDMDVFVEETFGPVVSVFEVPDDAHAVALANDTPYGLSASVWTSSRLRGRAMAAALRAGSVGINDGYAAAFASTSAPMGGTKASGLGRRHGAEGLLKHTWTQTVATQRLVGLGVPDGVDPQRYAAVATAGLRAMRRFGRR